MSEMKCYVERVREITEKGPDRVLVNAQGTAVPFDPTGKAAALPELVFIRKGDMWSLGCSRKLAEAAHALWQGKWLACIAFVSAESTAAEKPMLRLLDKWDAQPGVLPGDLADFLIVVGPLLAAQPVGIWTVGMARKLRAICGKWADAIGPEPAPGESVAPFLEVAAIAGAAGVLRSAGNAWFSAQQESGEILDPPDPPQFLPSVN